MYKVLDIGSISWGSPEVLVKEGKVMSLYAKLFNIFRTLFKTLPEKDALLNISHVNSVRKAGI